MSTSVLSESKKHVIYKCLDILGSLMLPLTDGIPFGYYGCDVYHLDGVCLLYTDVFSL
jgi:hypothetical protein